MKKHNSALFVVMSILLFSSRAFGCNENRDCTACTIQPRVLTAMKNKDWIAEFLAQKKCTEWKQLSFKAVVFQGDSLASCMTSDGAPYTQDLISTCSVAEEIEFRLDTDLAAQTQSPLTKWMAQNGQFECEPDGTMVFNRGRVRYARLDSLYEPAAFIPFAVDWPESSVTVGFQVFAPAELQEQHCGDACTFYCYDAMSAFILIFDIVDATGASVVSIPLK